jgi:hypothetical protein
MASVNVAVPKSAADEHRPLLRLDKSERRPNRCRYEGQLGILVPSGRSARLLISG